MGSLPDLTERMRAPPRVAARTVSDPHRNRTFIAQIPVSTICKKEWPWKKPKAPARSTTGAGARRRDSGTSSVGAASVRRLLARHPPRLPAPLLRRFTALCFASGLCATALLSFTVFAGAEAGAMPLALMHTVAAAVAPFTPFILQKIGSRPVMTLGHLLVGMLLAAHTVTTPLSVLLVLYGLCGALLSPMSLALCVAATSLAAAAGDETRRRAALRRSLRALRAAQDVGLVLGALILGAALLIWPEELTPYSTPTPTNITRWSPSEEYYIDDDLEENTCGAAGCPGGAGTAGGGTALSGAGRRAVVAAWAALALVGGGIAVMVAPPWPPRQPSQPLIDRRAVLALPMALFIGLQQGFIYTSYIKWYGVCVEGWWCAWRALCGAGALQTLAAGTVSMAAARGRRGALAAGGAAAHASLILALLRWRAARTDLALPALAAAAWGACSALWDVLQAGTCVGGGSWCGGWALVLCARHAGLALACAARALLCVRAQLAALAAAMLAALAAHAVLEINIRRGEPARHRS